MLAWTFSTKEYDYGSLYKNRANLSGNVEESDASITISQLTMDDNGTYECSVLLLNDLGGTSKARVRLLVLGECPFLWSAWVRRGAWTGAWRGCLDGCPEGEPRGGAWRVCPCFV